MTTRSDGVLEELDSAECLRLLDDRGIGRVAVVVDGDPIVMPVNYRVIDDDQGIGVVMRTQPGSLIDRALVVGFEVDGVDHVHRVGWSVLLRGLLDHLEPGPIGEEIDPAPWIADQSSWLVIRPTAITGRRLQPREQEWAFSLRAYL